MTDQPRVGVLIGSDSDLPVMRSCIETLKRFGIPHEVKVLSAHRTPDESAAFVKNAPQRGIQLFVCAAGGAAHLAGLVAAHPNAATAWVNLAVSYHTLKQREKAAQAIDKAMSLDPFNQTVQRYYDLFGPDTLRSGEATGASTGNP